MAELLSSKVLDLSTKNTVEVGSDEAKRIMKKAATILMNEEHNFCTTINTIAGGIYFIFKTIH